MLINHKKLNPNAFYLLKYLNDALFDSSSCMAVLHRVSLSV